MLNFTGLLEGFLHVFSPINLIMLTFGTLLGLFAGTLPGITGVTMLAVVLPMMIKVNIETAILVLVGIYASSVYSASTAGVLYNIPGGASGIPTTIEGYKLTLKGRADEALAADICSSFFGNTIGFVMIVIILPLFMYFVTFFGTGERALFSLWALILISSGILTREEPMKGILSMGVGLSIGLVGTQKNIGELRYTLGITDFYDGLHLIWVIIGLYAIPEILRLPLMNRDLVRKTSVLKIRRFISLFRNTFRKYFGLMCSTSIIGLIIGIIPGVGAVTASWIGYSEAQRTSKQKEIFGEGTGEGALEGIVGAEAANNTAAVGSFIPLLSLGIPGSGASAIILGAFILAGVFPGPRMMVENASTVWTILFGIGLSGVVFLLFAYPFMKMAQALVRLPIGEIIAFIAILSFFGTYITRYSMFGIYFVMGLGLVTIIARKLSFSVNSFLIGFILGPILEVEFIRAYQIGGLQRFLRPASLSLIVLLIGTVIFSYFHRKKAEVKDSNLKTDFQLAKRKDLIIGVIGLALAITIIITSDKFAFLARLWPLIVGIAFIGIPSLVLSGRSLSYFSEIKQWFKDRNRWSAVKPSFSKDQVSAIAIFGMLLLFAIFIPILGFIATAIFFAVPLGIYFSGKILRPVIISLLLGSFLYIMRIAFGFILPGGLIWG